jgi:hypothetical protein
MVLAVLAGLVDASNINRMFMEVAFAHDSTNLSWHKLFISKILSQSLSHDQQLLPSPPTRP